MPNILIIDDDKLVCEATSILLRSKGYQVTTANDGQSGIDAVRGGGIDLAIVDLFMPDMDGTVVMSILRDVDPTITMIAASGFMFGGRCPEMPGFEAMANEAGAVATLYKPFRPGDVVQAVEQALNVSA
ncbi:response regulator [Pseudorhodoplanes sinuspersici]|uniref:Uncharacterized protein n=1 Tax=Pseudorhodoplanes sinuspersici TaxID=1235591 RepID=A0A1W6ZVR3_9HYPH|nr:response regulator [Pseudorhodoplanes sinuspersici]ARQ01231.1 hypothetical protein CAK95_20630 [Pseudorhodoplanes sinuspersici]RKE72901.1 response regulator receiver domain-containing protein [Pseudorhodoplanes sinuspersici]